MAAALRIPSLGKYHGRKVRPSGFFRSLEKGSDPKPCTRIFTPIELLAKIFFNQARQTSPENIEGSQNKRRAAAQSNVPFHF
jgi:hypothetical protein